MGGGIAILLLLLLCSTPAYEGPIRHLDYSFLAWCHKPDPARLSRRTISTSSHILIIIVLADIISTVATLIVSSHIPQNSHQGVLQNSHTPSTSSPIESPHLILHLNLINSMNSAYADFNHRYSSSRQQPPLFLASLILANLLLESANAAHFFLPEFDSAAKEICREFICFQSTLAK